MSVFSASSKHFIMYLKFKKKLFPANVLSEKSNPDPSLIAKSRSMSKRVKLNVGGIRCKSKNHLKDISNMVSDMK